MKLKTNKKTHKRAKVKLTNQKKNDWYSISSTKRITQEF